MDEMADAAGWLVGRSDTTEIIAEMIEEAAGSLAAGAFAVDVPTTGMLADKSAITELANDATEDTGASGTADAT